MENQNVVETTTDRHLRFDTVEEEERTVVYLIGELDISTAPYLREELTRVSDAPSQKPIHVDLGQCRYMDSTGFSILIIALKRAREQNRLFALANPLPQIARQFYITGLDRVFTMLTVSTGATTVIQPYDQGRNSLKTTTTYEGNTVVIRVEGNIGIYAKSELPAEIRRILDEEAEKPIRVDLSKCVLSDLFYLNALLIEIQNIQKAVRVLAGSDPKIKGNRSIELKGVDHLLTAYLASNDVQESSPAIK